MRRPGQKHDPRLVLVLAVHLREHGLLARFHQLPAVELEFLILDDLLDVLVGRRTRLDAVDFLAKFVCMGGEVGKVLHAFACHIIRHGQRELCPFEVFHDDFCGFRLVEIVTELLLCGHPVAEENVKITGLERLIADRHGHGLYIGLIAETFQQHACDGVGGGDVGPARIGQPDGFASCGIGSRSRS